jgi:hypothetical protein
MNYLPGWLRTMLLLISASCVARIIGVSHQLPAIVHFKWTNFMICELYLNEELCKKLKNKTN